MTCPFCNNSDPKIIKGYWRLDNDLVFNSENGMHLENDVMNYHKNIVFSIINKYLDGNYSEENIMNFVKEEKYIIEYKCSNCNKHFEEVMNYYFYFHYIVILEDVFEDEYKKAFVNIFGINVDKLFDLSLNEKINTIDMFFDSKAKNSKKLFLARDLWNSLPQEKGGGEGNLFDISILTIVLGIVSAFLYDVLKIGGKKAYYKIKKMFMKKIIKLKFPKASMKRYLQSENIKYNEKILQDFIEEKTMEIINKYIEEIENMQNDA